VAHVKGLIETGAAELLLVRVAGGAEVATRPQDELTEIVRDLYRRMLDNRYVIKLVDRCAADYPGLHAVWFGQGRWAQHALLVSVIERRLRSGDYRPLVNASVSARMVLEAIAFWAVHRHFDPSPQQVDDDEVERALVQHCVRSLVKGAR